MRPDSRQTVMDSAMAAEESLVKQNNPKRKRCINTRKVPDHKNYLVTARTPW